MSQLSNKSNHDAFKKYTKLSCSLCSIEFTRTFTLLRHFSLVAVFHFLRLLFLFPGLTSKPRFAWRIDIYVYAYFLKCPCENGEAWNTEIWIFVLVWEYQITHFIQKIANSFTTQQLYLMEHYTWQLKWQVGYFLSTQIIFLRNK